MKDKTGNEIYSSNEDNACEEYSFFPAEDYKAKELSKEAKEHFEVDEFSLGKEPDRKEKEKIITAALQGGLVDSLYIDEPTAELIVRHN